MRRTTPLAVTLAGSTILAEPTLAQDSETLSLGEIVFEVQGAIRWARPRRPSRWRA